MSDSEKNVLKDEPIHGTGHIEDPDAGLSDEERAVIERRLLWKLDLTLMPWLCLLYLVCFLDRTNVGNAKIAHLTEDVPMTTSEYNATLTIFFVAYAVFEALANFLLKRTRPSIFIPIIM
jgi:sugar phosphate permease